jgi:hypothetical protein
MWKRVRDALLGSRAQSSSGEPDRPAPDPGAGDDHVARARESLRALLQDSAVPEPVRRGLAGDFAQVQAMLDKLEHGHIHIAVFGRVGVGKSALLNALLGERRFSTSPLHGETRDARMAQWETVSTGGVYLIDTPGINEVDGEARERLAHEVASRSDLVLFVVDGDISQTEVQALRQIARESRPPVLVFNKADRYTRSDRALVAEALARRTAGLAAPGPIVETAAEPAERIYVETDPAGREIEVLRAPPAEVQALRDRLWTILEREGKTLAALNASLFAGKLSDVLARRAVEAQRELADRIIRNYSLAKGIAVGFNPVPISDLMAAVAVDVSLVLHLSRLYGLGVTRHEAGDLIRTIGAQMTLLVGTVWAIHLVSSVIKGGSLGLSTLLTGAAQGAVAYYSTFVVGRAAQRYFQQGKSWGELGPKRTVQEILESVDRDSLLTEAREEILARLRVRA